MIVAAIVRQNILLNLALQAGWKFARYGYATQPALGHIEGHSDHTKAYDLDGKLVVVDTFYDASRISHGNSLVT